MKFLTELLNRWDQESPKFFKRVGALAVTVGVIGGAILATKLDPANTIRFGQVIYDIAEHMVSIGIIAKIVAASTVKDPNYATIDKKP